MHNTYTHIVYSLNCWIELKLHSTATHYKYMYTFFWIMTLHYDTCTCIMLQTSNDSIESVQCSLFQACQEIMPSFRQIQCSEFNLVPYKKKLFEWEPVSTSSELKWTEHSYTSKNIHITGDLLTMLWPSYYDDCWMNRRLWKCILGNKFCLGTSVAHLVIALVWRAW